MNSHDKRINVQSGLPMHTKFIHEHNSDGKHRIVAESDEGQWTGDWASFQNPATLEVVFEGVGHNFIAFSAFHGHIAGQGVMLLTNFTTEQKEL